MFPIVFVIGQVGIYHQTYGSDRMRIDTTKKPPTWVRMAKLKNNNREDPLKGIQEELKNATKPRLEEPALIHPFNTSVVKIRNNGMIDLWVSNDQGIRIDPNTSTINFIADGVKEHINYSRSWVAEDMEWWVKKSILFNSEQSSFTVNAHSGIFLNSERQIELTAGGDLLQKIARNMKVDSEGNIEIKAGGSITVNASGNLYLKGRKIYEN